MNRIYRLMIAGLMLVGLVTCAAGASTRLSKLNELSDTQLSDVQKTALRKIDKENKLRLAAVAVRVAAAAKLLYDNLLSEHPDRRLDQRLSRKMHVTAGELLTIRGQAFRQAVAILTPAQRRLVRKEMQKLDAPVDLLELIGKTFGAID